MSPSWLSPGHSPESGHFKNSSDFDITDIYLPWLQDYNQVAILSTVHAADLVDWTWRRKYPEKPLPEIRIGHLGANMDNNRRTFKSWVENTSAETVILIDFQKGSPFYFTGLSHYQQIRQLMRDQSIFIDSRRVLIENGSVSLWVRANT